MPFTGSHPAAVLPLLGLRLPLPASALVIGSMAPDIPYYEPFVAGPTHSAAGIVTVDLLLGAAAWALWHGLLAGPALAAAPRPVRARLVGRVDVGLRRRLAAVGLVVLALVVGAATHVGWDAFTHPGRFGTDHIAVLSSSWHGRPGYSWAQYASGLLGAAAIARWLARWWRTTPVRPVAATAAGPWVWVGLAAVGVLAGGWAALGAGTLRDAAFHGATTGAGAAVLVAVVPALAWHAARLLERRPA